MHTNYKLCVITIIIIIIIYYGTIVVVVVVLGYLTSIPKSADESSRILSETNGLSTRQGGESGYVGDCEGIDDSMHINLE